LGSGISKTLAIVIGVVILIAVVGIIIYMTSLPPAPTTTHNHTNHNTNNHTNHNTNNHSNYNACYS